MGGMTAMIAGTVIDGIFLMDAVARLIVAPSKVAFFVNVYNVIDVVVVFSLIIRANSTLRQSFGEDQENRVFSHALLLGFVPVMRLLKVLRYFKEFHLLIDAFRMAFDALPVMLYMYFLLILTCAALTFIVEPTST